MQFVLGNTISKNDLYDELAAAMTLINDIQNIVSDNYRKNGGANYGKNYNPIEFYDYMIFNPQIGQTMPGSGLIVEYGGTTSSLPLRVCTTIGGFGIGGNPSSGGQTADTYDKLFEIMEDKLNMELNTPIIKGDGYIFGDIGPFYSIHHPKYKNIGTSPVLTKTEDYIPRDVCINLWSDYINSVA